jgi:hypothetical protein
MRFAYILSLGACAHQVEGLVVLQDHTNRVCSVAATVYQRKQGPQLFRWKLDSEYGEEQLGRGHLETHLRVGKASGLSTELSERELGPCEDILARGSNEDQKEV